MDEFFPDPESPHIIPFAISFVTLMFAHAALDREIRNVLTAAIPSFQEDKKFSIRQIPHQLYTSMRKASCDNSDVEMTRKLLQQAILLYDFRNALAHGHWWRFDSLTGTIEIRRETVRPNEKRFICCTKADIAAKANQLRDIEAELYKIRRRYFPTA
jgi:hypothetical protein